MFKHLFFTCNFERSLCLRVFCFEFNVTEQGKGKARVNGHAKSMATKKSADVDSRNVFCMATACWIYCYCLMDIRTVKFELCTCIVTLPPLHLHLLQ